MQSRCMQQALPVAHAFHISQPCDFVPCEHFPHRRQRGRERESAVFRSVLPVNANMDLAAAGGGVDLLALAASDVFESPWPEGLISEEDHEAVLEAVEFPDFCCQVQISPPELS